MNAVAVTGAFFDRRYVVPAAPAECAPNEGTSNAPAIDAIAGKLVALFEALCVDELRSFLDEDAETLVATRIEWVQRAPVAAGAALRLTGWVEAAGERSATFRVQAHDAHEQVCEGRLRFDVDERARAERVLARKHAAAARGQLFWSA